MTEKFNHLKAYNDYMKARIDAGMPAIERSMVTLGRSFVWMSPEGMKTIEWSDMQDATKWEPINEVNPSNNTDTDNER